MTLRSLALIVRKFDTLGRVRTAQFLETVLDGAKMDDMPTSFVEDMHDVAIALETFAAQGQDDDDMVDDANDFLAEVEDSLKRHRGEFDTEHALSQVCNICECRRDAHEGMDHRFEVCS